MRSLWSDSEAERIAAHYAERGVGRDLALRVYTSRLLGNEPKLVLHGGGNTSVKTLVADLCGERAEVLCVKGSGWDLASIEPEGLPALRLAPLKRLRQRERLTDEEMVRIQRANLIDPAAPNPSVETLLHAFLPHKYIDHTHASAVLSLADQRDGAECCGDLYGRRLGLVPYVMPGFLLAKKAAEIFEADPAVEGLILLKHGLFTFGEEAREAYERTILMVTLTEERIALGRRVVFLPAALPCRIAETDEVAPILRGACAIADPRKEGAWKRFILDYRGGPEVLAYVGGAELARYGRAGVATPDHTLRTKNYPLILPPPEATKLDLFKEAVHTAVAQYVADYHAYFARHNEGEPVSKRELDPMPRVILVPGLGLFGLGRSKREAAIAADLAEASLEVVRGAEAIGRFEPVGEAELFAIEYWSLEQAKLKEGGEKPLAGEIAVVTGGAGTIGFATAGALKAAGAEVALFDRNASAVEEAAKRLGGFSLGIACDVTDAAQVASAFARVAIHFGGLDILVSNAGAAFLGSIGEVSESVLRASFELNFFAQQRVAQNALRLMLTQGTGGCLLFNVSKQALNPGPDFGPYGTAKAATLALMRQYALEYGRVGIRANAVNADRVKSGLLSPEMIAMRAKARGQSEREYMRGNLLGREVTAEDVAEAFLHQALSLKVTAGVATVDGGNIAAAPR
jgi:rhamnose utilization protein RhaD (predicted bifunctional aldolase and dehydrogenase)/NAD(P)-dependent dehydrogenase (short-subunit alcohol dehydrogenase family)